MYSKGLKQCSNLGCSLENADVDELWRFNLLLQSDIGFLQLHVVITMLNRSRSRFRSINWWLWSRKAVQMTFTHSDQLMWNSSSDCWRRLFPKHHYHSSKRRSLAAFGNSSPSKGFRSDCLKKPILLGSCNLAPSSVRGRRSVRRAVTLVSCVCHSFWSEWAVNLGVLYKNHVSQPRAKSSLLAPNDMQPIFIDVDRGRNPDRKWFLVHA